MCIRDRSDADPSREDEYDPFCEADAAPAPEPPKSFAISGLAYLRVQPLSAVIARFGDPTGPDGSEPSRSARPASSAVGPGSRGKG